MATRKTKIAIACQGGGSQTAFTAGVLKTLFEAEVHKRYNIVGLSGTSGGAICATLAWYALANGDAVPWQRLMDFWHENTAQTPAEEAFNDYIVESMRSVSRGHVAQFNMSPSSPYLKSMMETVASRFRPRFTDFRGLLEAHIDFDQIKKWGAGVDGPVLLLGAVNILTGKLVKFNSRDIPIRAEHILASCAVPNIFPAVEFDGGAYWDGLFSDNPPVNELIQARYMGAENLPNEIWVIKINPTGSDTVPVSPEAISDRRNELIGNVSLFQQLDMITLVNELILKNAFRGEFLKQFDVHEPVRIPKCFADDEERPYHIPFIEMSASLQSGLDYESKIDRSAKNISALIADGERQAHEFLKQRED